MMRVIVPLPATDFDPTEAAVPWRALQDAGHAVIFATPTGEPAKADGRMISGRGLGPWSPLLRARKDARALHAAMIESPAFCAPRAYADLEALEADGLMLAGGHAPGMKTYLESPEVQALARRFLTDEKPVGAICHGVVVLARSTDPATGRSLLAGRSVTALTAPMELSAWALTALWLGRYYRTYAQTVEAEVAAACGDPALFSRGPFAILRDGPDALERGFVVRDGKLVTARWPGDAHRFADAFVKLL